MKYSHATPKNVNEACTQRKQFIPITPELEKVISNLDAPATTKLFRVLTQNASCRQEALLLSQANSLVSIIAGLQLVKGGKL